MKITNPLGPLSHHHPSQIYSIPTTIFHQIRVISDDKYLLKDLERPLLELINSGHNMNKVYKDYKKYSTCSKMDLLWHSKDSYNLSRIRKQYNFTEDPYESYIEHKRIIKNNFGQNLHNNTHIYSKNDVIDELNNSKYKKPNSFFNTENIQIILEMHPNLPNMKKIFFNEIWNILQLDPDIVGPFGWLKKDMIEFRYKRPPNIRELLPIGYVPKPSERSPELIQHYNKYKLKYLEHHNLNSQFQPIIPSNIPINIPINSTAGLNIQEDLLSNEDFDMIANSLQPLNTSNNDENQINNNDIFITSEFESYKNIIIKIKQQSNLTSFQMKYAIISSYWTIKSFTHDNLNNINTINIDNYTLDYSILISQFIGNPQRKEKIIIIKDKNKQDIRSYFTNNKPNNNNIINEIQRIKSNKSTKGCFGCLKDCGVCTTKNRHGNTLLMQGDYYISS